MHPQRLKISRTLVTDKKTDGFYVFHNLMLLIILIHSKQIMPFFQKNKMNASVVYVIFSV